MKKIIKLLSVTLAVILAITTSCKKSSDSASNSGGGNTSSDVRVTTYNPQGITATTAVCGGDAIVTQGLSLSEIGVCWSAENNPTVEDARLSTTEWGAPFVCKITGLEPNTKYYVKAYALRGLEYYYGSEKSFTTSALNTTPEGAAAGLFSVSATQQVYFSQGNLQYQASTNTWRFAEYQWDYVGSQTPDYWGNYGGTISGSDNSHISSTYSGWIDLFGWGTSGYNHGAVCYQPWSTITNYSDYYAYGGDTYNLNDQTGKADWGHNAISNGGNTADTWRTLTKDEWVYLFNTRTAGGTVFGTSQARYTEATINTDGTSVNGVIVFPDGVDIGSDKVTTAGAVNGSSDWATKCTAAQWTALEGMGCVFLPAAGYRDGTTVYDAGSYGGYWSSTASNADRAYDVGFYSGLFSPQVNSTRYDGYSVRLVVGL